MHSIFAENLTSSQVNDISTQIHFHNITLPNYTSQYIGGEFTLS